MAAQIAPDDDAIASLTVLRDIDHNAHLTHALLRAHAPSCGVVTVHPTPGVSTVAGLAHDLLLALGHPPAGRGTRSHRHGNGVAGGDGVDPR